MDFNNYKQFLLSNIPTAKEASGGKFVACRCFYCPDGKSRDSRHFYIHIPESNDDPSWYYCHKCHNSGIVTNKTLLSWGIYDNNIGQELIYHNKKCARSTKNSRYYNYTSLNIRNIINDSELSRIKLDYINNRIGQNFTLQELSDLKICLNLLDLLNGNNIQTFTRDPRIVEQLNANFLGFLSIDNMFVNMRRLCDEGLVLNNIDKRYVNYKIMDKFDTSNRFYTVPTSIDLNYPERLKIHIAEGPFDILSIYTNLRNRERGIYTSIAGSNYLGIIFYFINTFKIPFFELHIYPDNDKSGSNEVMNRIANYIKPLINSPIYIHRNIYPNEKDFGVSPDKIKESVILL